MGATICTTFGAGGASLTGKDGTVHIDAVPVRPVDTDGAGDSFAAGFIAATLAGADPVVAARAGVRVAAAAIRALAPPLDVRFVDSGVETRQCLCLLDDAGVLTEVYEPVPPVPGDIWPGVLDAVAAEIGSADLIAISGRIPPGLPVDALAQIVDLAAGTPVIVDSDGPALVEAVRHGPTLVKVNDDEARAATGNAPDPLAALRRMGARSVVVTTGASGACYLGDVGLEVRHDPIPDALPVGSGDAFLAGLAAAFTSDIDEALRFAAAAARANARHLPAGDITRDSVRAELPSVRVVG